MQMCINPVQRMKTLSTNGKGAAAIKGLFTGRVETFEALDRRPLTTAIRKKRIDRVHLNILGFDTDESADNGHHTADRAVHLFSEEYYPAVETRLGVSLPRPAFGENLTTIGLKDSDVRVGDLIAVGDAVISVTQPTERCSVIGRSLGLPKILKVLHDLSVCGFYAKVITPGEVRAGDAITINRRADHNWTIEKLHRFMFNELADDALMSQVLAISTLSDEWKARVRIMRGRSYRGEPSSSNLIPD